MSGIITGGCDSGDKGKVSAGCVQPATRTFGASVPDHVEWRREARQRWVLFTDEVAGDNGPRRPDLHGAPKPTCSSHACGPSAKPVNEPESPSRLGSALSTSNFGWSLAGGSGKR